jgi:hypothetical protein
MAVDQRAPRARDKDRDVAARPRRSSDDSYVSPVIKYQVVAHVLDVSYPPGTCRRLVHRGQRQSTNEDDQHHDSRFGAPSAQPDYDFHSGRLGSAPLCTQAVRMGPICRSPNLQGKPD